MGPHGHRWTAKKEETLDHHAFKISLTRETNKVPGPVNKSATFEIQ
jgi:hypothetical protein